MIQAIKRRSEQATKISGNVSCPKRGLLGFVDFIHIFANFILHGLTTHKLPPE